MKYQEYSKRTEEQRKAFRRVTDNYSKNVYDQVSFCVPKGSRALIAEVANSVGISQAEFLRSAIMEKMISLGFEEHAEALQPGKATAARNAENLIFMLDQLMDDQTPDIDKLLIKFKQIIGIMECMEQPLDAQNGKVILHKLAQIPNTLLPNKSDLARKIENIIND